jgi:hypothetical protein
MDWQKQKINEKWTDKMPPLIHKQTNMFKQKKLLLFVASYNDGQNTTRVKEMQKFEHL